MTRLFHNVKVLFPVRFPMANSSPLRVAVHCVAMRGLLIGVIRTTSTIRGSRFLLNRPLVVTTRRP